MNDFLLFSQSFPSELLFFKYWTSLIAHIFLTFPPSFHLCLLLYFLWNFLKLTFQPIYWCFSFFAIMFLISESFLSALWIFFFLVISWPDHGCHVRCYIWENSSNKCFPLIFFSHAVIVLQVAFSSYSLWLFFVDPFLSAHWSESLKADWMLWVWEWSMHIYSFTVGWSWLTISC